MWIVRVISAIIQFSHLQEEWLVEALPDKCNLGRHLPLRRTVSMELPLHYQIKTALEQEIFHLLLLTYGRNVCVQGWGMV